VKAEGMKAVITIFGSGVMISHDVFPT